MKKSIKFARKAGILLVGIPVVAVGIALLVLPGPGLLVIIFGLVILSVEFEVAKKYRDKSREQLKKAYELAKNQKSSKSRNKDKEKKNSKQV